MTSAAQPSSLFTKTQMCKFQAAGKCKRGAACFFAHSRQELRAAPDLRCTRICPTLVAGGRCVNPKCNYAHKRAELRDSVKTSGAPHPGVPRPGVVAMEEGGEIQRTQFQPAQILASSSAPHSARQAPTGKEVERRGCNEALQGYQLQKMRRRVPVINLDVAIVPLMAGGRAAGPSWRQEQDCGNQTTLAAPCTPVASASSTPQEKLYAPQPSSFSRGSTVDSVSCDDNTTSDHDSSSGHDSHQDDIDKRISGIDNENRTHGEEEVFGVENDLRLFNVTTIIKNTFVEVVATSAVNHAALRRVQTTLF